MSGTMNYLYQAEACATRLNAHTGEQRDTDWWSDIVDDYDYDRRLTEAADRSGRSDIIVWPDGTRLVYDEPAGEWQVREVREVRK